MASNTPSTRSPASGNGKLRVLVLWSQPSGYVAACLNALVHSSRADVLFIGEAPDTQQAPYDMAALQSEFRSEFLQHPIDFMALSDIAENFGPNIILAGGSWRNAAYRKLLRQFRRRAVRVMCSDTQKTGSARQTIRALAMRIQRRLHYDRAFVAGERQAALARTIGFPASSITTGLYSCDHGRFLTAAPTRTGGPAFLFVGRLVETKGIAELVAGYRAYRNRSADPWPLTICGTGPMKDSVSAVEGVDDRGFIQPSVLPGILAGHTALIVPSHVEPWGLVVHEAVSANMIVVCSSACGSGDAFVRNGENGTVFDEVSAESICEAMLWLDRCSSDTLASMRVRSAELARVNTPELWVDRVLSFA